MAGRTIAAVAVSLVLASLPVFLVGALAPRIGPELGLSEAALGGAIGAFFAAAALAAIPGGRLTDRIGASLALRVGVAASGVWLLVLGLVVRGPVGLIIVLFLAGASLGLVDPGGARALATSVRDERRGTGFGIKEASIPSASLLAGAALPLLVGWRGGFIAGGLVAFSALALVSGSRPVVWLPFLTEDHPRGTNRSTSAPAPQDQDHGTAGSADTAEPAGAAAAGDAGGAGGGVTDRSGAGLLAVVAALGGAGAAATVAFLVPAAVASGASEADAGVVLVVASLTAVLMRLAMGLAADAHAHRAPVLLTICLLVGALGLAGIGRVPLVAAATLALGAGWGWTGLVFLAAVQRAPAAPARAAGIVLAGLGVGGALGPMTFGQLVDRTGYASAWGSAALALLIAGLLAAVVARGGGDAGEHDADRRGTTGS